MAKKTETRGYHSVGSPANLNYFVRVCSANLNSRPSLLALGRADASIALLSLLANFKQSKELFDVFTIL